MASSDKQLLPQGNRVEEVPRPALRGHPPRSRKRTRQGHLHRDELQGPLRGAGRPRPHRARRLQQVPQLHRRTH